MTYFYAQLFTMDTEIRAMFPAAMDVQRRRFFSALSQIAAAQESPEDRDRLVPYLRELGRAHRKFGVRERHYEVFRRALIATLQRFAAPSWNETAKHAWETAFNHAAGVMIDAAKDDEAQSPAWWIATVTEMELRGPDIAVLTLQPEQPLTYLSGQHISVQTPHWPRLWRTYSIANAPRPDGLIRLHVRAVPGGLVSPVLVHQLRQGDPLVLGAPAGAMTAETQSARDVLCLAGGTGLAPVKAVIEALISAPGPGRHREIVLYHGARRHQDLYDLRALRDMEKAYPQLQVIPAVSDEPAHDVMYGTVPELAAKANCADRDIYISGPDQMIVRTARTLMERGAARHLIHYDLDPRVIQGTEDRRY
ncbi:MAG TPA: globin domain-containing protein [Streptosporangiaceae bacterium]|jgi:NAD(P)H-flavin reductase